jgi:hypothetical protein
MYLQQVYNNNDLKIKVNTHYTERVNETFLPSVGHSVYKVPVCTSHRTKCASIRKNKTGNIRNNVTVRCVRVTIVTVERRKCYTFSVCICSLSYESLRRTSSSSVGSLAVPYFSTLPYKLHDFSKTLSNIKYMFWFHFNFRVKYLIPRRTEIS